jgi:hypothetical protein
MPLVLADKIKVRTRTTGTSSFLIENAFAGFRGFEAVGNGNETYYSVADSIGNWEIGRGVYSQGSSTLTRDSVLSSSYNNQKINFPAGAKTLSVTFPAELANAQSYQISAETAAGGAALRFSTTEANIDDVNFIGSSGIVITRSDSNNISIASNISVTQSAETTSGGAILRLNQNGSTDDISLIGSDGIVVTRVNDSSISITTDISQSVELAGSNVVLRLARAGAANDDITVTGSNGTTISRTDANTINIDTNMAQGMAVVFGI